jgi:hypothetical protein
VRQATIDGQQGSLRHRSKTPSALQTIAILPDGRLAVSFLDSTTHYPSPTTGAQQTRPALAIEQTTTLAR